MEENNNYTESNKHYEKEHHQCWKKCIITAIAAFLGSLLAFYFIADQITERMVKSRFNPNHFEKRMLNDMDRMYKEDMKAFNDAFDFDKKLRNKHHQNMLNTMFIMDSVNIKTEYDGKKYNIIVGLKPFQNDENKVNYKLNGRKLTVFGNSEVREKDYENDIAFSQDFILPANADTNSITKVKDGNKLIISVPMNE